MVYDVYLELTPRTLVHTSLAIAGYEPKDNGCEHGEICMSLIISSYSCFC